MQSCQSDLRMVLLQLVKQLLKRGLHAVRLRVRACACGRVGVHVGACECVCVDSMTVN